MNKILSLGAGVQSTVMALMSAHGELPPVDCAIFADTMWEPEGVYSHLNWLESVVSNPLRVDYPFPVYKVSAGDIKSDGLKGINSTGQGFANLPFFIKKTNGEVGFGRRQCTKEYKIEPIRKKIRTLLGVKKGKRVPKGVMVEQWIGISTDEAVRMKPSRDKWCENRWPLIEKNMSRQDCIRWFEEKYPMQVLEKSACIGCPFRNDAGWREMKITDPKSFSEAVAFDLSLRNHQNGRSNFEGELYLHRSCKPLSQVDFRNLEDKGQMNMFNNECEGMCGV